MSLFQQIRDGLVTKQACESQLAKRIADKIELVRNSSQYGPDLYAKTMSELELSISLLTIMVEKFDDLKGEKNESAS